jgi:hypothetical protein
MLSVEKSLRGGRLFILSLAFRGFSPWSLGSFDSGPVVRQNIMVAGVGGGF